MNSPRFTRSLLPLALAGLLAGPAAAGGCGSSCGQAKPVRQAPDIVDTARAAGSFDTLVAAIQAAGLTPTLQGQGPFTVFAPTDEAFARLPAGTVESLLRPENRNRLTEILTYHVVAGRLNASDVVGGSRHLATVEGRTLEVSQQGSTVWIGGARVVTADIRASNGVIHVIDRVLIPAQEPAAVAESTQDAQPRQTAQPDLLATARAAGNFDTLIALVHAAGLTEALQGEDELTVFAPTDAAFEKLPEETLESLLAPEGREQLQGILTYHVLPGRVTAAQALATGSAETLQGAHLSVRRTADGVFAGPARVVTTDVVAKNGVIHVIDSVLLPPADDEQAARDRHFPAIQGTNLEGRTFDLPGDFEGDYNLVLVAFKRQQQRDVDTWMPLAEQLSRQHDGFVCYELPVLAREWSVVRGFIDGGMRSGIPSQETRERTITVYTDKASFRAPLEIVTEDRIHAFLVARGGKLLWSQAGPCSTAAAGELAGLLSGLNNLASN
jgi:uncharacterized surface protein with fasciclin (FAS1) repeats